MHAQTRTNPCAVCSADAEFSLSENTAATSLLTRVSALQLLHRMLVLHPDTRLTIAKWINDGKIVVRRAAMDATVHGASIVSVCGCLQSCFPLNDAHVDVLVKQRGALGKTAVKSVHEYFGPRVALYFAFLRHLTRWLVVPGVVGAAVAAYDWLVGPPPFLLQALLFVTISLWCAMSSVFWGRAEALLSVQWGTHDAGDDDVRVAFACNPETVMSPSRIHGKPVLYFSPARRRLRVMCSAAVIAAVVLVVVAAFLSSAFARIALQPLEKSGILPLGSATYLGSLVHAVEISAVNVLYMKLAKWLTDWGTCILITHDSCTCCAMGCCRARMCVPSVPSASAVCRGQRTTGQIQPTKTPASTRRSVRGHRDDHSAQCDCRHDDHSVHDPLVSVQHSNSSAATLRYFTSRLSSPIRC
jgi:hypothetical protein